MRGRELSTHDAQRVTITVGVTADSAVTPTVIVAIVTVIGLAAFYAWARAKHLP